MFEGVVDRPVEARLEKSGGGMQVVTAFYYAKIPKAEGGTSHVAERGRGACAMCRQVSRNSEAQVDHRCL